MKKLLSIVLALALVLGMSTAVFANGNTDVPGYVEFLGKKPTFTKTYQPNSGTAPAATFTWSFKAVSWKDNAGTEGAVSDMPGIDPVSTTFEATSTAVNKNVEIPITLANYDSLGVYTYEVTETKGTLAGVTYNETPLYLVLSIIRGLDGEKNFVAALHQGSVSGEKTCGVTNTYDSGSLTVKKIVKGNMSVTDKKFKFTITFDANALAWTNAISSTGDGTWSEDGKTYTINLAHNETVTLSNIPAGVSYVVTEDADGYESKVEGLASYTMTAGAEMNVVFENTLEQDIDTGINLDSLPYILLLAVVCVGLVGFLSKKRMMHR